MFQWTDLVAVVILIVAMLMAMDGARRVIRIVKSWPGRVQFFALSALNAVIVVICPLVLERIVQTTSTTAAAATHAREACMALGCTAAVLFFICGIFACDVK